MKKFIFIILAILIYGTGLVLKGEQVKISKNKDVPTLYKYWEQSGTPVYAEKAVVKSLSDTIAVTGIKTSQKRVRALVAPRIANKLKIGAIARVSNGDTFYNGKVTFVSKEVDELSGLYEIFITFSKNIISSKSVVVQVEVGYLDRSVVIKREAVSTRGGKAHIYVVNGDRLEKRYVKTIGNNDVYYSLGQGLKSGEQVVVSDQRYLRDNQRVSIIKRLE